MVDFCSWVPAWVNVYYENMYTYATHFFILKVEARVRFVRRKWRKWR